MTAQSSRAQIFQTIEQEEWDLIVIGGGITGAGILREAARRNLNALLVEQKDFAWGTSSRSGKLVHGGLRYMQQGNFLLTYESVREREALLRELPGLVSSLGMVMTIYKNSWFQRLLVHSALIVYDIMSARWRKHLYSLKKMLQRQPHIRQKDLDCGLLFYESVTDDARLVFRVLDQAIMEGGKAVNYCRVNKLLKENNRVCGVAMEDTLTGDQLNAKAKQVINATGAWADHLRQDVNKANSAKVRPLRGSHLIFSADRLPVTESVAITHPTSKRPGFVIPWEGRVMTGNTDLDHTADMKEEAAITGEEVEYLLENVQHHFPDLGITRDDIITTFSGVRPVVDSGKVDPSKESRDHVVWKEDGLLTVTGGKLTTFRLIALDALKNVQDTLGPLPDLTKKQSIFTPLTKIKPIPGELDGDKLERLQGRYGNRTQELIAAAGEGEFEEIPGTHTLWVELRWAVMSEAVVHLDDLMLRRTRIALLLDNGGKAFLPRIRSICQPLLGWSDDRWQQEEQDYLDLWKRSYSVPT